MRSLLRVGGVYLSKIAGVDGMCDIIYSKYGKDMNGVDGIFVSNGAGNPEDCVEVIKFLKDVLVLNEKRKIGAKGEEGKMIPIFGICLGHQLLSLAAGFETYKLKYGNRGHNIPSQLVGTKKCFITSQNHGYAVRGNVDGWMPLFINANDNSNEGMVCLEAPYFSVQFHPEAKAGPDDTGYLFKFFCELFSSGCSDGIDGTLYDKLVLNLTKDCGTTIEYEKRKKVLILGSGGLSIGQAGEFDYSGSQAVKSYQEEGIETILINPNIATVQTSKGLADKIYYLPVTSHFVEEVIKKEQPDSIALSFGGQTALNCGIELFDKGIVCNSGDGGGGGCEVLGTPVEAIKLSEDRGKFRDMLLSIDEKMAPSKCANTVDDALVVAHEIGYPVLVRAAFALGGLGSGFSNNDQELVDLVGIALCNSPQVIIDKSLKGWKEVEYEIVRDRYDNCIAVCNMENIDPLGVHTGESIVVAPSQTLNDDDYFKLRAVAFKVVRELGIVGECNIQYALDPMSGVYYIIEVNARLSRSSALASKATGYPLAYLAAKLSLGYSLLDIKNSVTKVTSSCAEPSLDYCVVKVPRWDLQKFPQANVKIGSSMKSVGEVMAISRSFEEAFQKALRMADDCVYGFEPLTDKDDVENVIEDDLENPSYKRMRSLATAFYNGMSVDKAWKLSKIDKWFLKKMKKIIDMMKEIENVGVGGITRDMIYRTKRCGFSDIGLSKILGSTEMAIRTVRLKHNVMPVTKRIDTVAAEFPCDTNYLYSTYNGDYNDVDYDGDADVVDGGAIDGKKIIVVGSGVYRIGSSVEFDWCAVNCVKQLRSLGYQTIMINYNPETVSTDYDEVDKLYFEEITVESVMGIYAKENPVGIILSMGGQVANNIAMALYKMGVKILGTSPVRIDEAENRFKFSRMLDRLKIDQPEWRELTDVDDAIAFCEEVGYPCLIRPSYVLSGAAMNVAYNEEELKSYLGEAVSVSPEYPVVVSKFIGDAKEIEFDGVAVDGEVRLSAVSEHIENAGVHSGDATLVLPAQDLTDVTIRKVKTTAGKIAKNLDITGPFNIQFIAKDDAIKVIECNLRVSRSFPFVSKVFDCNFIEYATDVIMGIGKDRDFGRYWEPVDNKIGVKVAQFSFNRLENADTKLGVEMRSTGEVACFGYNKEIAYLKALMASRFEVSDRGCVVVSIGGEKFRKEFFESFSEMFGLKSKYNVICTKGTGKYYGSNVPVKSDDQIIQMMRNGEVNLFINISEDSGIKSGIKSRGWKMRRCAVDSGISLITNIKCAKLYVKSVMKCYDEYLKINNIDMVNSDDPSVNNKIAELENSFGRGDDVDGGDDAGGVDSVDVSVLQGVSVMNEEMFHRNNLRYVFAKAMQMKQSKNNSYSDCLKGKIVGMLFTEPSSRTFLSFSSAIKRLGGEVLELNLSNSSMKKGESLRDTLLTFETYIDCLIVRSGSDEIMNTVVGVVKKVPVINAGWGNKSHPTQALTDILTIREERGTVSGIDIAIVGDLRGGRTIKSLVRMLTNYRIKIRFVPYEGCEVEDDLMLWLLNRNIDVKNYSINDFTNVLKKCNVVYMTRLQKERGSVTTNRIRLVPSMLTGCKSDLVIMHPLPRGDELSEEIDNDLRCAYFRQMEYGMWVRMALLHSILV